eukprot:scaffold1388_cov390-Prasinococcus_capsulatus_cf.AAC.11
MWVRVRLTSATAQSGETFPASLCEPSRRRGRRPRGGGPGPFRERGSNSPGGRCARLPGMPAVRRRARAGLPMSSSSSR